MIIKMYESAKTTVVTFPYASFIILCFLSKTKSEVKSLQMLSSFLAPKLNFSLMAELMPFRADLFHQLTVLSMRDYMSS